MTNSGYNTYHTSVKTSYALGIQEQVLPPEFINSVPRSTSKGWEDKKPEDYVGSEFAAQVEADLNKVKTLLDERLRQMSNAFYAFARLYLTILEFIDRDNFKKIILQNRETVIDLIDNLPFEFDKDIICKFLLVSPHQFKIWKNNRLFACSKSLVGYCTKRFPNQISQKEINTLKSLMSRKAFESWSTASIWGFAFKRNIISMSRSSFYRYCLKLGISPKTTKYKKKRRKESVKASLPNEIWHMDITEFKTTDNKIFYIHSVLDNFSRKIVGYTIERTKRAKCRLKSLRQAIQDEFEINLTINKEDRPNIDLIVDGGTENNNVHVRNFIRNSHVNIHKKIALKEVRFSNSMIEGNFKMLKKFLRSRGEIHSTKIHNEVDYFIKTHNEKKPTYQHQIHTPNQVHLNPELVNVKPILQKVNKERLTDNRTSCCKI